MAFANRPYIARSVSLLRRFFYARNTIQKIDLASPAAAITNSESKSDYSINESTH